MEWVETTGKTVAQAKDLALDRLGVDEADAEFEVLEEPRPGLFGRVRGEARVRARVRPATPRPKLDRRRGRRTGGSDARTNGGADAESGTETARPTLSKKPAQRARSKGPASKRQESAMSDQNQASLGSSSDAPSVVDESVAATEFLVGLIDACNLQASISVVEVEAGELEAQIDGDDLGVLIGPRGQTLQSLQEITRLAVQQRRGGARGGWLRVDVSGYRAKRRDALVRFTNKVAAEVVASGEPRSLEPMTAADRKVVHDAAAAFAGVATTSEGEDPHRRVVIRPANG